MLGGAAGQVEQGAVADVREADVGHRAQEAGDRVGGDRQHVPALVRNVRLHVHSTNFKVVVKDQCADSAGQAYTVSVQFKLQILIQ